MHRSFNQQKMRRRGRRSSGRPSGSAPGRNSNRCCSRTPTFPSSGQFRASLDSTIPQMRHNGHVVSYLTLSSGPVRQVGPVATMDRSPSRIARSAPSWVSMAPYLRPRPPFSPRHPDQGAPLVGVTIVEFGFFFAMPFGVSLASSLGARVIKLEDANGDPIRQAFGGYAGCAKVMEGKESLSVDLKSAEGPSDRANKIIESADVFVFGFRSGVAERVGLDYETLTCHQPSARLRPLEWLRS